jgi:hypothetical protein
VNAGSEAVFNLLGFLVLSLTNTDCRRGTCIADQRGRRQVSFADLNMLGG